MEANLRELDDKTDEFILKQYKIRFMYDNAPKQIVAPNNKEQYFTFLKSILVNDMKVLITHSSRCDSRTFNTIKINEIVDDNPLNYIGSINMIVDELPEILNNQLFVDRFHMVCGRLDEKKKTNNTQKIYEMFKGKNRL